MNRAALSDESSPELFKHAIDLDQRAPEAGCVHRIVVTLSRVLLERDSVGHFARCRVNADIEVERGEILEDRLVELGYGTGLEGYEPPPPIDRLDHQLVLEEIETHLEGRTLVRDRRGTQTPCRHV